MDDETREKDSAPEEARSDPVKESTRSSNGMMDEGTLRDPALEEAKSSDKGIDDEGIGGREKYRGILCVVVAEKNTSEEV
ncbi:hypothetical protein ACLOJK_025707 [Asimina triloba]